MCNCAELADAVEAIPSREQFLLNKKVVARASDLWAELAVCDDCGQRWRVEVGAEVDRRANIAFRVAQVENWRQLDIMPALDELRIRKAGGLDEASCIWQGCENHALLNSAVCVRHAYPRRTETK